MAERGRLFKKSFWACIIADCRSGNLRASCHGIVIYTLKGRRIKKGKNFKREQGCFLNWGQKLQRDPSSKMLWSLDAVVPDSLLCYSHLYDTIFWPDKPDLGTQPGWEWTVRAGVLLDAEERALAPTFPAVSWHAACSHDISWSWSWRFMVYFYSNIFKQLSSNL